VLRLRLSEKTLNEFSDAVAKGAAKKNQHFQICPLTIALGQIDKSSVKLSNSPSLSISFFFRVSSVPKFGTKRAFLCTACAAAIGMCKKHHTMPKILEQS